MGVSSGVAIRSRPAQQTECGSAGGPTNSPSGQENRAEALRRPTAFMHGDIEHADDHADRAGEPGNAAGGRDCDQARGQDKGREGTATQRLDEFLDADLVTLSRRRFKTVQHLVQRSNVRSCGRVQMGSASAAAAQPLLVIHRFRNSAPPCGGKGDRPYSSFSGTGRCGRSCHRTPTSGRKTADAACPTLRWQAQAGEDRNDCRDPCDAATPGDQRHMTSEDSGSPILKPGKTCWRIEHAQRLSVIVDAADYFKTIRVAIRQARHTVMLIGWDFDTRIKLDPLDGSTDVPNRLGKFLSWAVKRRPDLTIYILKWDLGMVQALGRGATPMLVFDWMTNSRIRFKLDHAHPPGATHHQKIVVIDDALAFCGGIDMTADRWDTREHRDEDPHRTRPRPSGSTVHGTT